MSSYEDSTSHIFLCILHGIKVEDQTTRTALSWTKALAACLHSPFLRDLIAKGHSSSNQQGPCIHLGHRVEHLWG